MIIELRGNLMLVCYTWDGCRRACTELFFMGAVGNIVLFRTMQHGDVLNPKSNTWNTLGEGQILNIK